jgi:hypothetical protein
MSLANDSVGNGIKPGDKMVLGESIHSSLGPGIISRSPHW